MMDVCNLPLTSRLCFTLWGYSNLKKASASRLAMVCVDVVVAIFI